MKKLFILLLTALLMIAFAACSVVENPETTTQKSHIAGEFEFIHFCTLEEIAAFAKSDQAPDNFVLYDAISILGAFDDYFASSPFKDTYRYNLVDSKQYRFAFGVYTHEFWFATPKKILKEKKDMENMVYLGTEETGWIRRDYLNYSYVEGYLRAIYIQEEDIQIFISVTGDDIRKYPVDENGNYTTYIERLVFGDEEEALAAADEFITFFRNNR